MSGKRITGTTKFVVKLAGSEIKTPSVVDNQLSKDVTVTVDCQYEQYSKQIGIYTYYKAENKNICGVRNP